MADPIRFYVRSSKQVWGVFFCQQVVVWHPDGLLVFPEAEGSKARLLSEIGVMNSFLTLMQHNVLNMLVVPRSLNYRFLHLFSTWGSLLPISLIFLSQSAL